MSDWLVYLLECSDGTYYCGATNDLQKRLKTHNRGKGARYTRGRLPVKVVASRGNLTRGEALRFERQVKKLPRGRKVAEIHGNVAELG